MEIVTDKPKISPELKASRENTLKLIKEAYAKGFLTIKPAFKYRKQLPKPGDVFYRIIWKEKDVNKVAIYYNGAYQINKFSADQLQADGRLIDFIQAQLAIAMTGLPGELPKTH